MAKNYSNGNSEKEVHLLERRLIDLSRVAYQRDIITFTDFLNLNEQNILHTLPKDSLYTGYILFGGYASAERQMAAFIPEALSLRYGKKNLLPEELGYPFQAVEICPRNIRFAELEAGPRDLRCPVRRRARPVQNGGENRGRHGIPSVPDRQ